MLWPRSFSKKIKSRVSLAPLTSLKVGGAADFFFEAGTLDELKGILEFAAGKRLPVFILGKGSNILVGDSGVKGLVVKLNGGFFRHLYKDGACLGAGAGLALARVVSYAKENSLSGMEFLAGLPGTVGGALAGNAGAWGGSIADVVEEVCVLDFHGKPGIFSRNELEFSYRRSNLSGLVIVSARFRLKKGGKRVIAAKIKEYLSRRKETQGDSLPSAGCVFRNPQGLSAGRLIDACGLKGVSRGQAVISRSHANFILNKGGASAVDISALMKLMRDKVREKFKVNLEHEVKIWK